MPTASRQVRKTRRIKRNASLAHRQLRTFYGSYEQLRAFAQGLKAELDLRDAAKEAPIVKEPNFTITRIPDEEPIDNIS